LGAAQIKTNYVVLAILKFYHLIDNNKMVRYNQKQGNDGEE